MSEAVKLSIILPCLKRDALAERAIRSVGSAPDGVELEWVIVEGVSPLGRARNVGLSRATGDYIAWIDGDDEVTAEWFPEIVRALRDRPDVVLFDIEAVGWAKLKDMVYGGDAHPDPEAVTRDVYRNVRLQSHVWRVVSRRSLWEAIPFDDQRTAPEDFPVLPLLMARAKSIVYVPKKLYRYIRNDGSLMNAGNVTRTVQFAAIALERFERSEPRFASAALWGTADILYRTLFALNAGSVDLADGDRLVRANSRKFLARHLFALWRESAFLGSLRLRLRWELKFLMAAFGLWGLQGLGRRNG